VIRLTRGESLVLRISSRADFVLPRWKGQLEGREGSFPANFVEVV